MMDKTCLWSGIPRAAQAADSWQVRIGWAVTRNRRRVGDVWELRADMPLGRTPLPGHVPTVPEEQKAHVVYPNGDSQ